MYSAIAASKGSIVYAFEPIPGCVSVLEKVQEIYPKIKICKIAISDETGFVQMTNTDDIESNSIVTGKSNKETIKVKCQRVDDFVKENGIKEVNFIKADIEGAERKMLAGATETLKNLQPDLSLCTYHYEDDPAVLQKLVSQANPDYKIIHKYKKLYASVK